MIWLAASFAVCQTIQTNLLDPGLAASWTKIAPSVVIVEQRGSKKGTAALISAQGYFLTGNSVVAGAQSLDGVFFDGQHITLFPVAVDGPTQLVLLRTYDSVANRASVPLFQRSENRISPDHPMTLLAALPTGPVAATIVNTNVLALLRSARSIATLSEIHLESSGARFAGSPLFTPEGAMVGILQATLAPDRSAVQIQAPLGYEPSRSANEAMVPRIERRGITIAYSPSPSVMQRIVSGFLTKSHEVLRPAIGVFCRDASGGGALVAAVEDDSPAAHAGIKEGDVILSIEASPVHRQVDFAQIMLGQEIGADVHIAIRRNGRMMNFRVRVGM